MRSFGSAISDDVLTPSPLFNFFFRNPEEPTSTDSRTSK